MTYPAQAKSLGIEGTVIVVFVVNADGSLSDVEVLRGIGGGADEAAVRVVQNSPDWTPGKQRGNAINTRMRLPIRFKLDGGESKSTVTQTKPANDFPETIQVPVSI